MIIEKIEYDSDMLDDRCDVCGCLIFHVLDTRDETDAQFAVGIGDNILHPICALVAANKIEGVATRQ